MAYLVTAAGAEKLRAALLPLQAAADIQAVRLAARVELRAFVATASPVQHSAYFDDGVLGVESAVPLAWAAADAPPASSRAPDEL